MSVKFVAESKVESQSGQKLNDLIHRTLEVTNLKSGKHFSWNFGPICIIFCYKKMGYDIVVEYVFSHFCDQFHYIGWPDFGAPATTHSIIVLAKAVRKIVASKNTNVKILVHCSAGVGRTGTFIALYQFMEILDEKIPEYKKLQRLSRPGDLEEMAIDIFNRVFTLRKQRCEMVSIINVKHFTYTFNMNIVHVTTS